MIGADPVGSIFSGGPGPAPTSSRAWARTSGRRASTPRSWTATCTVSDRDSFLATRRLAQTEGILAGGSGGTALHAALEVAREIDDPEALVAVILPDGGRSYLSKIYNDAWMTEHGFLERGASRTVGDAASHKHEEDAIAAAGHRRQPQPRPGRRGAAARARRLAAARRLRPRPAQRSSGSIGERGLLRARGRRPGPAGRPDRRRASSPRSPPSRPRSRCATRSSCSPASARRCSSPWPAARRGSSRAPTCSRHWSR